HAFCRAESVSIGFHQLVSDDGDAEVLRGPKPCVSSTIYVLTLHRVWSISTSIALAESLVPDQATRPWFGWARTGGDGRRAGISWAPRRTESGGGRRADSMVKSPGELFAPPGDNSRGRRSSGLR